jgi:hypothetical protein
MVTVSASTIHQEIRRERSERYKLKVMVRSCNLSFICSRPAVWRELRMQEIYAMRCPTLVEVSSHFGTPERLSLS